MVIRCPKCSRFMAEVGEYGRAVCRECGVEVTVRVKGERQPAS
jgi:DNA-directed RNA polymerase subunit RPC12/RpoP